MPVNIFRKYCLYALLSLQPHHSPAKAHRPIISEAKYLLHYIGFYSVPTALRSSRHIKQLCFYSPHNQDNSGHHRHSRLWHTANLTLRCPDNLQAASHIACMLVQSNFLRNSNRRDDDKYAPPAAYIPHFPE